MPEPTHAFMGSLAEVLVAIDRTDPSSDGTEDRADAPERYDERNRLIWQAVALAATQGLPCGVAFDADLDPDWPLVYIDLPGIGQVSWHVPAYPRAWDGHTTAEKRARLLTYAAANLRAADA